MSYAHTDCAVVYPELERIAAHGVRIWYDEGIEPTREWTEEIALAINEASLFVVVITPASAASRNVRNEVNAALSWGKPVLAIHLTSTVLPKGMELQLASLQAIMRWQMDDRDYADKLAWALAAYATPSIRATPGTVAAPAASGEVPHAAALASASKDAGSVSAAIRGQRTKAGARRAWIACTSTAAIVAVAAGVAVALLSPANGRAAKPAYHRDVTLKDPGSRGVTSLAFGRRDATLATGDFNGTTYVWNLAKHKITEALPDPASRAVKSVAFSPGWTALAAGDFNGTTYVWNLATRNITEELTDPGSKGVVSVAYGPAGRLAVGDLNGTTYVWNLAARKIAEKLPDPGSGGVYSVAFSTGGATLAVADGDGDADLWNLARRKITETLSGPGRPGSVYSVAFSPDGTTLASGTDLLTTGNVYVWNLAARKIIQTLPVPQGSAVLSVAFKVIPSGTTIAVGYTNGYISGSTYMWTKPG